MGYRNYSTAVSHIVSPDGQGDFTTIGAALTAAVSGQTIFIRPGTYTENPTLKAGVNLTAFPCDSGSINEATAESLVIISGTCTFSAAGTVSMSGICFQTNGSNAIVISGSVASYLILTNCTLYGIANSIVSMTSSNTGCHFQCVDCEFDLATTGINYFSTSHGNLSFFECYFENSGASATASLIQNDTQANFYNCGLIGAPVTTSGTSSTAIYNCIFSTNNSTSLTVGGTGVGNIVTGSTFMSGTASAISVSASCTLTITLSTVKSSNTNAITGSGTLNYGGIAFSGTSSTINTTTVNPLPVLPVSASSITLTGDSGAGLTGNSFTFHSTSTAGSSTSFSGSGTTLSLNVTDANDNVIVGGSAGNGSISGTANAGFGFASLNALTSGTDNMGIGYASLDGVKTGSYNVAIGANTGTAYTTSESSNILFNTTGVISESNVFRVGNGTGTSAQQISKAIINGIAGTTVTSPSYVSINTSTGQLGQASANQTQSTRCCVTAVLSASTTNNTGDGTTYTIVWNQVTAPGFDQGSNFNTGTGTFTAPVTGKYLVCVNATLNGVQAAATDGLLQIVVAGTSGQTYNLSRNLPKDNSGSTFTANAIVAMTATDTLTTPITISGLTKSIGIQGGTNFPSLLSITLVC